MKEILQVISNKENYDRFVPLLNIKLLPRESQNLVKEFKIYYDAFPAESCIDFDKFTTWFTVTCPSKYSKEETKLLLKLIGSVAKSGSISDETLIKEITASLIAQDYCVKVGELGYKGAEGKKPAEDALDECFSLIQEYDKEVDRVSSYDKFLITKDITELVDDVIGDNGLEWSLDCLNKSLGPLRKGDFIIFGARPDTGKTTILARESGFMAKQLPDDVDALWINNEEVGSKVKLRLVQSVLGKTVQEIKDNPVIAQEDFVKELLRLNRVRIFDKPSVSVHDVEGLLKNGKYGLIIFDQLWKVRGFEKETTGDVQRQTALCNWARELAKQYGPVITVHQADGTAEGQKWIDMSQLYGSKCLAKGTPVLMYNGTTKAVEDIVVGDLVMGVDSSPRTVSMVGSGKEQLYTVTHKNGLSYTVNESHILTLKKTTSEIRYGLNKGSIVDVPLKTILSNPNMLSHLKGFTVPIEFKDEVLPIDPYIFGLWLSDGHSKRAEWATKDTEFRDAIKNYAHTNGYEYKEHTDGSCWYPRLKYKQGVTHPYINLLKELGVYGNKHIPFIYTRGTIAQRLQFLAGMIDGDGNINKRSHIYYTICSNDSAVAQSLMLIAISCGFNSTVRKRKKHFIVHISGNISQIPVRIKRKKTDYNSTKDVTISTLTITPCEIDTYYGFTVDVDSRYVLGNFIPTHNTGMQGEADAIITMGRVFEAGLENSRYIFIPKNKLVGGPKTDPKMRNAKWEIKILPEIARFKE